MDKSGFGATAFDGSNLAAAPAGPVELAAPAALAGGDAVALAAPRNRLAAVGLSPPIPLVKPAIVAPLVDPNCGEASLVEPSLVEPIGGGCGGNPAAIRWRGASDRSGLDG
jgi:hypothetical protein